MELNNINIKVTSIVLSPSLLLAENQLTQVNSDQYSLRFISQGEILFSGKNKYVADNLYMAGKDVTVNAITLLITNYNNGPYVNVYIQSTNKLTFTEETNISGGRILIRGDNGILFMNPTSILNNKATNGVSSDYTL